MRLGGYVGFLRGLVNFANKLTLREAEGGLAAMPGFHLNSVGLCEYMAYFQFKKLTRYLWHFHCFQNSLA